MCAGDDRNKARDPHLGGFLSQIVEARAFDRSHQKPDIGLAGFGRCLWARLVRRHERDLAFVNGGDMRVPFTITAIENQHRIIRGGA